MKLFKRKAKIENFEQINPKENAANAFNVLYQDTVNERNFSQNETPEYASARSLVDNFYYELDSAVLEYLSTYMIINPKGRIEFLPSEEAFVDLYCEQSNTSEFVQFEKNGRIACRRVRVVSDNQEQQAR